MEILNFIKRRFSDNCNWLDGNCYYFSLILLSRFPDGKIYYDVINGHFIYGIDNKFFDWSGEILPDGYLVEWNKFKEYESLQYEIIVRDCIK